MNELGWQTRGQLSGLDRALKKAAREGDVETAEAIRDEVAILLRDAREAVEDASKRRERNTRKANR